VLSKQHRAFLLHQLANAENGQLTQKDAAKVPDWAKKQLGLSPGEAKRLVEQLTGEQLLVSIKEGRSRNVQITPQGQEHLAEIKEFIPRQLTDAEQKANEVRAKAAALGEEELVAASKLGKPKASAAPEVQQAFVDALNELLKAKSLHQHGTKYGKKAPPTLGEVVRLEVQTKLDTAEGPFKPADLSKPKRGATADEKQAHTDALNAVIADLIAAKKLFPHPGGKYGQLAFVEPDYPDREVREVYTLHQFFRAASHTIAKAEIELAFPGKGKPDLKALKTKHPNVVAFRGQGCFEMGAPATRQTLEQLVSSGDLSVEGEAYTLTDAGAKRLEQARSKFPVLPPVGDPATPDGAAMREMWEAFVLLRLADAAGFTLGESAVFKGGYPKGSKLNEATAWVLYGELAKAGYVVPRWNGTEGEYMLTPQGLRYLAGLSFNGLDNLAVKGSTWTALLSAARGGERTAPTPTPTTPPPADLEAAVMEIFHRLLRERHANDTRVPIHEVRAEVARLHGPSPAAHDTLDPVLNRLDKTGKVRLVEIDDRGRATAQQLQDSMHVSSGTLFFMKRVDNAYQVR
jgi:DNA-binding PadR family transcriptional regulator